MTVRYEVIDEVAVLTMSSPPVNALGHAVRARLMAGLARADADVAVAAIVVRGDGGNFSAGADIKEFASGLSLKDPHLLTVFATIEASPKPVVAAIEGVCMGGGLELALACHGRVAAPGARVALPEIRLGLIPGAGGTQRLPRVVGVEKALELIVTGATALSEELAALPGQRLFDSLSRDADRLLEDAVCCARDAARAPGGLLLVRHLPSPADVSPPADGMPASVPRAVKGLRAARLGVDAVRAAARLPFDEGLALERRHFEELKTLPESAALRHLFAAERAASRIRGVRPDEPRRDIRSVGIVGAGTMGRGIAMSFLDAGLPVTLVDTSEDALGRAVAAIRGQYESQVARGRLTAEELRRRAAALRSSVDDRDLGDAELLVEAAWEDLPTKLELFARLDRVARDGAILASNTSTLDIDRIAAATRRPADVLGLHFFSPAHVMRLLEVVRGAATSADVLATAMVLGRRLGKVPVVSGVCDGFIGNRMFGQYIRQAGLLLDEGVAPEEVDAAMEAFGFAMGPFRTCDLAGNDIGWAIRKRRLAEQPALRYGRFLDVICERGRYGQKTGAGWYDYPAGVRAGVPSAEVRSLLASHWRALDVRPGRLAAADIVDRLVHALVDEGEALLAEGIAERPSDLDLVLVHGYGFPAAKGGPMFHAGRTGSSGRAPAPA